MANTQTLTINNSFTNATNRTVSRSFTGSVTCSGAQYQIATQAIGTSDESVAINSDISSLGYIYVRNLDGTNYVELGYTSGTYFGKLKAGEACVFRAGAGLTTLHAKANTATCDIEYFVLPD
jgi:hypothetical protein